MSSDALGHIGLAAGRAPAGFYRRHLLWPLLAFIAAAAVLELFDIDRAWARRLYTAQGSDWTLRSSFVADTVIHTGGRLLAITAWLAVLAIWIAALRRERLASWRWPLAYLLLATASAALLVGWMKSWTNMDCPWDVLGYGGTRPHHGLFATRPAGVRGTCFPAAHASAGYCWLALYFFFLATRPRFRSLGLAVAIGLGVLVGFTQQLRGAHFFSHDLWSLAICWLVALGLYAAMLRGRTQAECP